MCMVLKHSSGCGSVGQNANHPDERSDISCVCATTPPRIDCELVGVLYLMETSYPMPRQFAGPKTGSECRELTQ